MERALLLAARGKERVSPNPAVGCVVVKNGKIIAEGYHKKFGDDHAEIVALKKLESDEARGATMYVTLEPCCHYGKTPPCVDGIIKRGIKNIVIAMKDPNPIVNARSVRLLKKACINVELGLCSEEARALNEAYIKYITTGIPFVTLKIAMSLDGMISKQRGKKTWLTSPVTDRFVHRLRAESDAIIVGKNTVMIDNPHLGCRLVKGRDPLRVVLGDKKQIPGNYKIFRDDNVFFYTGRDLRALLRRLGKRSISTVLVEGGAEVFTSFVNSKLVDRIIVIFTPKLIGNPNSVPAFTDRIKNKIFVGKTSIKISGKDGVFTGAVSHEKP